jgi:hypothetical protein
MPITYERDDVRRLVTVTMTEPVSFADLLSVVDRQAAENAWEYAVFYDQRGMQTVATPAEFATFADHVRTVGGGRQRGPVGVAVSLRPASVREALAHTKRLGAKLPFEMLLTDAQVDEWYARHGRMKSSDRP